MPEQICIPLRPHTHRYLQFELEEHNGHLYLSEQDRVSQYLLGLLEKRDYPEKREGVTLTFHAQNRFRDFRYAAAGVSEDSVRRINSLLEHMMFKELFTVLAYIDRAPSRSARYGKKKPLILEFCDKYDPDSEVLNYDMVNERYKRWRKKQKEKVQ